MKRPNEQNNDEVLLEGSRGTIRMSVGVLLTELMATIRRSVGVPSEGVLDTIGRDWKD